MKFFVGFLMVIGFASFAKAQVPEFDKLEMLYAQNHYKMVYRKANRLLDIPDYDWSQIPKFYKALSLFQLSQNEHWLINHPNALDDASALFREIKKSSDGRKIFNSHMYEISFLKHDLIAWAEDLKRRNQKDEFEHLQKAMAGLFDEIPDLEYPTSNSNEFANTNKDAELDMYAKERVAIVEFAKKYIGTPYVWAGNEPTGFDCSGFTSYVMKNFKKELPRRAVDQYNSSRQLKEKNVMMGDLVFFDNGSGISHVGMIISEKGKPLVMIHASSSKGVVITEIEKSDYWLKRLYGFGTYVY
jgi:cell wall-associated NlpC family hydrolase